MDKQKLNALLETENEQLGKLNKMVIDSIAEEKLLANKIIEFESTIPGTGGRMADMVASFGGSWKFIISFIVFMLLWIAMNVYLLQFSFDPYPFILLNLMLSAIAAIQAPIIMMSQNRKETKDRQRAINDYMINLKAEVEIRNIHNKLDLLIAEQMKSLFELQRMQIEQMDEIRNLIGVDKPGIKD